MAEELKKLPKSQLVEIMTIYIYILQLINYNDCSVDFYVLSSELYW